MATGAGASSSTVKQRRKATADSMRKALRGLIQRDRGRPEEGSVSRESSISTLAIEERNTRATEVSNPTLAASVTGAVGDSVSENLWFRAYQALFKREPELVQDFELHIGARQDADASPSNGPSMAAHRSMLSSPKAVEEVLEALQDERKNKQWKISVRSKDHKVKDQLEMLVKLLTLADGVVKQATSAQPYAALAWSAVSVFLPLLSGGFSKDKAMVQGFTTIGDLQLYWKNCEDVYLRSTSSEHYQELVEPLSNVYSYMLEYQVRAICHLSQKQLSRAWEKVSGHDDWAGKETHIVHISDKCNAHITPLQKKEIRQNFELEMAKLDRIWEVGTGILETIKDQTQKSAEERFLQKLKSAAQDYWGGMEFNPEPVRGTCEWFYNDANFSNWLDSAGSGVFWITAGPGCGKSVLARSLVKYGHLQNTTTTVDMGSSAGVESRKTTLCFFFFKDESAQRSSMNSALSAILHQLFVQESTRDLIKEALPAFNRNGDALTESFDDLWSMLITCAEKNAGGDIICVLDALDECNSSDRDRFINRLDRLYADGSLFSAPNLKFLITSRPYDDIERSFRPFSRRTEYFRFDADERHVEISHDIGLVIDAKMDNFATDFDEEDRQKIAASLKSRGTKTYLWLHLTLSIIVRRPSQYSRRRDVEKLLSDIPSQVSDAYEKIMSRTEDDRTTSVLLQILLAATRPLTLEEANYALTLATADNGFKSHAELDAECWQGDFKAVVKNFCGLIISVYDGKLSFIHLTAREFFLKKPEPDMPAMKWAGRFADPAATHGVITRCSMQYLLLSDFASRNLPPVKDDTEEYKFLCYAATNWSDHFRALGNAVTNDYLQQARQLCSTSQTPLKTWGRLYLRELDGVRYPYSTFFGWSDLAVASFIGLEAIVEDLLNDSNVDINEICDGYGSALHAAAAGCQQDITALLISRNAEIDMELERSKGTPLGVAVVLQRHLGITKLLLANGASPLAMSEHGRRPLTILSHAAMLPEKHIFYACVAQLADISTNEAILSAATKPAIVTSGKECVALLLDLLDDNTFGSEKFLTEDTLKVLFSVPSVGSRVLRLICQQSRHYLLFKSSMLEQVSRTKNINHILRKLLRQTEAPCQAITQDVLETIALHYESATLRLFIEYSPTGCCTMKDLFLKTVSNRRCRSAPLVILEFAAAAVAADEQLLHNFVDRMFDIEPIYGFLKFPHLTPSLKKRLIARIMYRARFAPQRQNEFTELLRQVLHHGGCIKIVDSELLEKAAKYCGVKEVKLLREHSSGVCMAGEVFLRAAARNYYHGMAVMEFLLRTYESEAVITPGVVENAMVSYNRVLELLLERRAEDVVITADALILVGNGEKLQTILKWRRDEVAQVASEALHKATKPMGYHGIAMELLLTYCPISWFEPTEELMLNVLEEYAPIPNVSLLVNKFDNKIVMTERILSAAAAVNDGGEVLEIFRSWKPAEFKITPWIIEKTAAGGCKSGLDYLARCSDGKWIIEEKWYRLAGFRYAVFEGVPEMLDEIWAEATVTDVADAHGKTALHVAATGPYVARERLAIMRFLLEVADADVHAADRRGWTPLHFAVRTDSIGLVQMLIAAGADPYKAALDGETPISYVERDEAEGDLYMDSYSSLLILQDEWYAGFWGLIIGMEEESDT